jgi:serine/threonine protein kinase
MFKSEVSNVVPCYGISKDKEGNYIMVMNYMKKGNLREYLRKNYRNLDLEEKLLFLKQITQGLKDIHRKHLVHQDFHSGNIVVDEKIKYYGGEITCHITDLGLSKPVSEKESENTIYGLMPYMAPEVLGRGKPYTQAADIYSLGMIMYEIVAGMPPFYNELHDIGLILQICKGVRPQFPEKVKYLQILVDLIKQCWDNEPNNRPTIKKISRIVGE